MLSAKVRGSPEPWLLLSLQHSVLSPCFGEGMDSQGRQNSMDSDIARVLIGREDIARRVEQLAGEIAGVYQATGESIVVVPVLAGALIFAADLIRRLPLRAQIGVLQATSYTGMEGSTPQILYGPGEQVRDRHVLIVDDILDSGRTLQAVAAELEHYQPASLRSCVLLRKPGKALPAVKADFVGFDVEDVFVVGYGLDFNGYYRNWPDIGILRRNSTDDRRGGKTGLLQRGARAQPARARAGADAGAGRVAGRGRTGPAGGQAEPVVHPSAERGMAGRIGAHRPAGLLSVLAACRGGRQADRAGSDGDQPGADLGGDVSVGVAACTC